MFPLVCLKKKLKKKKKEYSSDHIFCQSRGTRLPAIGAITLGLCIVMENCDVLHCVQYTPFRYIVNDVAFFLEGSKSNSYCC